MANDPSISACLVVKNEELFLEDCLKSLRPVADEIVVIDTGSADRTVEIARGLADIVSEEPWPGDLAQAHDLPVAHASGDWIMTLDGDEVLDPSATDRLSAALAKAKHSGFRMTVRNYHNFPVAMMRRVSPFDLLSRGASVWAPSHNVRLYRNLPGTRHEGRLHQSPLRSIEAIGGLIGTLDVPIHHYGFLREDRAKGPAYRQLATAEAKAHPEDPKRLLEVGGILEAEEALEDADAIFRQAVALGARAEGHLHLARLAWLEHRLPETVLHGQTSLAALADGAAMHFSEPADVHLLLGDALRELGRFDAAEAAFRSAFDLRPDDPRAAHGLAALLFRRGAMTDGWPLAERLVADWPGFVYGWLARGIGHLVAGAAYAAVKDFEVAYDIQPDNPFVALNLSIANARLGRNEPARRAFERAVAADPRGRLGPEVRRLLPSPRSRRQPQRLGPEGVLTFVAALWGGGGFAAIQVLRALAPDRPQALVTLGDGIDGGEGIHELGASLDVPLWTVASRRELLDVMAAAAPGAVVHTWWPTRTIGALERVGNEALILNSANPNPSPHGYDHYVTLTDYQAMRQVHLAPERVHRIPNGVDLRLFDEALPDETYWRPRDPGRAPIVRIAMLTRLDATKLTARLADHLMPLARLPVEVVIAGRGQRRWELVPHLAERGLGEMIRFVGPIPQHRVEHFLKAADIGLHLTETAQETNCFSVLQMMAASLPVVSQPRGCLPEIVAHGRSGWLASGPAEIAAHLEMLVADGACRARMGAAARREVSRFSFDLYRRRWRSLVSQALTERT